MLAYIIRRLLLIIPTLFGIMVINFAIIQAAPGGPVEQLIAELERSSIASALAATGGNKVSAAKMLGISRATLYEKLAAAKRTS